jgi:hypothetical protein
MDGPPAVPIYPSVKRISEDEDECATLVERNRQVKTKWNMKLF